MYRKIAALTLCIVDEDMTHEDSLDLTIEIDAAAGVHVMLTAVNSRDVDIELQVQVCCMLLHFNLRLMNFQKDLSNVQILLNKYFRRPSYLFNPRLS